MARRKKEEMISFKVDGGLSKALQGVPNRSAFIRGAVLAALDNVCPLCQGTGLLSPDQKMHWATFSERHPLQECSDCHAMYLDCNAAK
ncbi:MAG TPA: CopG family transcriptional regulator [Candidatus Hydrogenedentes bacterium]|nr:CopG family transcriptional regulator [Candidatus Hydrogenedentota bacterium]HIJ73588.1 CopG family transcriptional regulator [Candidatus Hydrogenedentota bacterium]